MRTGSLLLLVLGLILAGLFWLLAGLSVKVPQVEPNLAACASLPQSAYVRCVTSAGLAARAQMGYFVNIQQQDFLLAWMFATLAGILAVQFASGLLPPLLRKAARLSLFGFSLLLGIAVIQLAQWGSQVDEITKTCSFCQSWPASYFESQYYWPMNVGFATFLLLCAAYVGFVVSGRNFGWGWLESLWNPVAFFVTPALLVLEVPLMANYAYAYADMGIILSWHTAIFTNVNVLHFAYWLAFPGLLVIPALGLCVGYCRVWKGWR